MNERDWEKYRTHIKDSIPTVWRVAKYLSSRGHTVQIPPTHIAANQSDRISMTDNGDLFLLQRCEVKQRTFVFSGINDYPWESIMICNKNSFDRRSGSKPAFYILPSADFKAMIVIDVNKTEKNWWAEKKRDSRYEDVEETFYFIDKNNPNISWMTLPGDEESNSHND